MFIYSIFLTCRLCLMHIIRVPSEGKVYRFTYCNRFKSTWYVIIILYTYNKIIFLQDP